MMEKSVAGASRMELCRAILAQMLEKDGEGEWGNHKPLC